MQKQELLCGASMLQSDPNRWTQHPGWGLNTYFRLRSNILRIGQFRQYLQTRVSLLAASAPHFNYPTRPPAPPELKNVTPKICSVPRCLCGESVLVAALPQHGFAASRLRVRSSGLSVLRMKKRLLQGLRRVMRVRKWPLRGLRTLLRVRKWPLQAR
jgi:hypothetical protein